MISVETAKSEIVDVIETIEKWIPMFEQGNAPAVLVDVMELLDSKQAEIERLKEQQPKWIPVDERLPEEDGFYLVCNRGFLPWIAELKTFMGIRGWCNGANMPVVKMWMPLPKTPEDGEQE